MQIRPGLPPPSPRNGNISNSRRRLSAISPWNWLNLESGDRPQIRKRPPLAGISEVTEGNIPGRRCGWLGREDSNPEMVNWKLRVPVPGLTSACSAKPSGVEATIKAYLTEIRNRLDKAAGIGRAADACASAGFHEKGLEVALDIEQLLYEATTLVNAASLINRIARQG